MHSQTGDFLNTRTPEGFTLNPRVSVVIPVRNDADNLRACLDALRNSTYSDYETIVVDDASSDKTAEVAEQMEARVVRLRSRLGPAGARNAGAQCARGEYLLFVDADVGVGGDTIGRFVAHLERDPATDAAFGSYNSQPASGNLVSQYRNLLHHHVHQTASPAAGTFWSGCGIIRRAVFLEFGGFDASYGRPAIEDIELGMRLAKAGRCIRLCKDVQVTHRKRWTLWTMVRTDILDRAIPWTQLILKEKSLPNDLNLKTSQRIGGLCSCLLVATLLTLSVSTPILWAVLVLLLGGFVILDRWSLNHPIPRLARIAAVTLAAGVAVRFTFEFGVVFLAVLILAAGVAALNLPLLEFFGRVRRPLFIGIALPLHTLYLTYSSVTFAGCVLWHLATHLATRAVYRRHPRLPRRASSGSE